LEPNSSEGPGPDFDKAWQDEGKAAAAGQGDGLTGSYAVEDGGSDGQGNEDTLAVQQREQFLSMRIAGLTRDIDSGYFGRWLKSVVARDPERAKHVDDPRILLQKYQQELAALQDQSG